MGHGGWESGRPTPPVSGFAADDARLSAMHGYTPAVKFLPCGVCHTGMRTLGELCPVHAAHAVRGVHFVEVTPDA